MTDQFTTPMSYPPRYPMSQPFPRQQPQPPQPPRAPTRWAPVVLMIAAGFVFAVAAVFAGLYIDADGDHDAAASLFGERQTRLADVREQVTATEEEKSGAEQRGADLDAEKTTLTTCVDAVHHYLWDGLTDTENDAAFDAMFTACQ